MIYKRPYQFTIPQFHDICERNGHLKSSKYVGLGHSDASS